MPPISLHMVLARRLADDLGQDTLATHAGPYLLGATTPDIRVITRQDRRSTHFFDLNTFEHQDSVAGFFEEYRHLAARDRLNDQTAAFICGYLTHLVFDEQYITAIYRKYFARHDEIGGAVRANVMDRLLQFGLDMEHANDPAFRASAAKALAFTVENIDIGFIEPETMEAWRQVALEIAARNLDWDRARAMIANHLRRADIPESESLMDFLDSLPELLDETIAYVTSAGVEDYLQRATDTAARAVERYLCG